MSKEKIVVDLSFWQDPRLINYDLLASQIDGVIIRAAYGTSKDTKFETHYTEFRKRNVPVGAYHYILGNVSIPSQANAFLSYTAGKTLDLGLWMDVEDTRAGTKLSRKQVLDYAALVPSAGIYTSYYKWLEIMGGVYLTDRKLWVAHYGATTPKLPDGWTDYYLWQYTSEGRLDGYNGNLDMNKVGTQGTTPPEPSTPYKAKVYSWATPYVNVRNKASMSGEIVNRNYPLDTVDVKGKSGDWLQFANGYSMAKYYEVKTETVKPLPEPDPIPTNPKVLAQRDPRWANIKLGYSPTITIGQQGCLITSLTMVLNHYGYNETPATVNAKLQDPKIHGFVAGQPNMYWKSPLAVWSIDYPVWREPWFGKTDLNEINTWLAKGAWALVHVDLDLETYAVEQHWVVLTERVGDDYRTLDPWQGDEILFSTRFGKPENGIYRVCIYSK